jgi:hypothetical protein
MKGFTGSTDDKADKSPSDILEAKTEKTKLLLK